MSSNDKNNSNVESALIRLQTLVEQAHGDAGVLPQIQQILDDNPQIGSISAIWRIT